MIDCIISSKDRACQLNLLLRSIIKNFKEIRKIKVLYKATTNAFEEGYQLLQLGLFKELDIEFIKETKFGDDYRKILAKLDAPYLMNFCDDNVVITDESVAHLFYLLANDSQICTASLRLNPAYNFCHPANKIIEIPKFITVSPYLKWNWTKYDPFTCWGYPHPVDNNIYRMNYYKNLISKCPLRSPCIEIELVCRLDKSKPYMVSLQRTKIITITNNRANNWGQNRFNDNPSYSLENLNKVYLAGKVINLEDIMDNHKNVHSGHTEYEWKYE